MCGGTAGTSSGSRGSGGSGGGGAGGGGTHVPIHRLSSIGKLTPAAAAAGGGGTAAGEYSLEDGLFARLACPYTTPNWQPPSTGHILLCGGVVPMGICARCLVEHWPHVSITALCAIPARGAASLPAWLEKAGTCASSRRQHITPPPLALSPLTSLPPSCPTRHAPILPTLTPHHSTRERSQLRRPRLRRSGHSLFCSPLLPSG